MRLPSGLSLWPLEGNRFADLWISAVIILQSGALSAREGHEIPWLRSFDHRAYLLTSCAFSAQTKIPPKRDFSEMRSLLFQLFILYFTATEETIAGTTGL